MTQERHSAWGRQGGRTPNAVAQTGELIDTGRNKMFAKRDTQGRFREMDDVSRSPAADRRRTAKTISKPGTGITGTARERP
jgi:hypothetical protein